MRISDWSSDVCSSDLGNGPFVLPSPLHQTPLDRVPDHSAAISAVELVDRHDSCGRGDIDFCQPFAANDIDTHEKQPRSEEHTSELQSLMRNSYAVFCLKKKKNIKNIKITQTINNEKEQKHRKTNI